MDNEEVKVAGEQEAEGVQSSKEGEQDPEMAAATHTNDNESFGEGDTPEASKAQGKALAVAEEPPTSTPEVDGNRGNDRTKSAFPEPSIRNLGGLLTGTSKFASLRAAFEQQGSTADRAGYETKRRLTSSGKGVETSRETNQDFGTEIVRLKEELKKEKDLRIAYEDKVTSLEEEVEALSSQLAERDDLWRDEYERKSLKMRSEVEDQLSVMQNEARSQRLEAGNLQKQLSDLKRSVSLSTRATTQVSDSTFREEIGTLQHEVQNWVVNNFRRVKSEASPDELCEKLEKVTEPKHLERLRPIYTTFESSVKLPIYQATVACYMMEIFEEPFLFGLQAKPEWSKRARQAAETLPAALKPATYNLWRAITFDSLRQSESMEPLVESAAHAIAEMICITLQAMTEGEDSEARLTSLTATIKRSVSLAHLIRVQKAQYEFFLPLPGQVFDPATMDNIADDSDADADKERTVRCATFPSITKIGDEEGEHLDLQNIVVKAKVLCNEIEP